MVILTVPFYVDMGMRFLARKCGLLATQSSKFSTSIVAMANSKTPDYTKSVYTKEQHLALRKKHFGKNLELFFAENPIKVNRASGQYLFDENGTQFLDCINNVAHVGHCHPYVAAQVSRQLHTQGTNQRYPHDTLVLLAERLASTLPSGLDVCYVTNSGSEANDLSYRIAKAVTGSRELFVFDHAYHGHVSTTMAMSPYKFRKARSEMASWVHVLPCPDTYRGDYTTQQFTPEKCDDLYTADAMERIRNLSQDHNGKIAGFIHESILSCGGQVVLPDKYLTRVYKEVRSHGGLCIADEVQAGLARCGESYWSFQHYGRDIIPDMVVVGKSLGNGFPISAVITTRAIADKFADVTKTAYFNTFGGNPPANVAALSVMDVVERSHMGQHAAAIGELLLEKLRTLQAQYPDIIGDVRGVGLMIGVDIVTDSVSRIADTQFAKAVKSKMRNTEHVIVSTDGPFDNVLKFKPPMCFDANDVDTLVNGLHRSIETLSNQLRRSDIDESAQLMGKPKLPSASIQD